MATYYVKNGGSDSNDGSSDALAWETITNYRVYNNTIYDTTPTGGADIVSSIITSSGTFPDNEFYLRNNIFSLGYFWYAFDASANGHSYGVVHNNNIYYELYPTTTKPGLDDDTHACPSGDVAVLGGADPLFVNAGGTTAEDYKIISNSVALNAGSWFGLTPDYFGSAVGSSPDIGAHEYIYPQIKTYLKHKRLA